MDSKKRRGNPDPSSARAQRTRNKHERWAAEMREAGYFVAHTGTLPAGYDQNAPRLDAQLYATNHLGETYRVIGWSHGLPLLAGRADDDPFPGMFRYLYTLGPRA